MNRKHTPGPWFVSTDGTATGAWFTLLTDNFTNPDDNELWRAEVGRTHACFTRDGTKEPGVVATYAQRPDLFTAYDWHLSHEEALANATLMAAAPDLLGALLAAIEIIRAIHGFEFDSDSEAESAWKRYTKSPVMAAIKEALLRAINPQIIPNEN